MPLTVFYWWYKTVRMRTYIVCVIIIFVLISFIYSSNVNAAPQLLSRSASSTSSQPSGTFSTTFTFQIPASPSSAVQGIQITFCDTPLGTCTTSNTPTIPASTTVSQSGWAPSTAFASYARQNGTDSNGSGGGSNGTNNQIQVTRSATGNVTSVTPTNLTIGFTGLTNNATANKAYYPRIRLYSSDTTLNNTTFVWEGVVAQSTSQTLTVNARVQEILQFCVGTTAVDDATTAVAGDCSGVSGTTVNLGTIDSGSVNVTPVPAIAGGNAFNGVAMVRTNAFNGVAVDYQAILDTSSGKLKVSGASCSGVLTTDQCFNSTGTTQNTLVSGTEEFGMTIAGVNCGSTVSYTCTFSSGAYNLLRDTQYDGPGTNTYTAEAGVNTGAPYTTSNLYAWDDTGAADRIASSTSSTIKVVEDEALILKFAATSSITTPTGAYTAQADFIATPTF